MPLSAAQSPTRRRPLGGSSRRHPLVTRVRCPRGAEPYRDSPATTPQMPTNPFYSGGDPTEDDGDGYY